MDEDETSEVQLLPFAFFFGKLRDPAAQVGGGNMTGGDGLAHRGVAWGRGRCALSVSERLEEIPADLGGCFPFLGRPSSSFISAILRSCPCLP